MTLSKAPSKSIMYKLYSTTFWFWALPTLLKGFFKSYKEIRKSITFTGMKALEKSPKPNIRYFFLLLCTHATVIFFCRALYRGCKPPISS